MTNRIGILIASALSLGLLACGPGAVSTRSGTTTIDESFDLDGTGWQGSDAVSLLAFATRERAGLVEVCGAIITEGAGLYSSFEPQVLRGSYIKLNGTTVANSIQYFNRLPGATRDLVDSNVIGKEANCATTGVAWSPAFDNAEPELVIRLTKVTY